VANLKLEGEFITLAQALKVAALAASGGEAKHLVRSGGVQVNGSVELQPGRKLRAGDRFAVEAGEEWVVG
jgi:ribosome-associated protein